MDTERHGPEVSAVPSTGDIQVLIVGDTVGALSLAGFLERAGIDPVVVELGERLEAPRGPVTLWPDAVTLLARLGGELRETGQDVQTWTRRCPDGTVVTRLNADGPFGFVTVMNGQLRSRLRERLPDDILRTGLTLRSLDPRRGGVAVEFGNGVREQFDIVVGADGVHSRTRDLLGGSTPAFCGTTSVALPLVHGISLDEATEVWTEDGTVFRAVPVGDRVAGWITIPTTVPEQAWSDTAALAAELPDIDWCFPAALEAVDLETAWWGDDFHYRADCWVEDRVALIGDAAHARHRLTATGTTLAVEDAAALAAELVGRTDPPAARLADYAARRQARLERLGNDMDAEVPLADVESVLADRYPSVPAARGARLAAGFGADPPTPSVEAITEEDRS